MSSQGQVCNPPCPSPCQSAFPHIACPYSLFLPKSFPKIVSRAGLQSSFSFSLSVSTFPYDAFLYSLFTPKCFQGQVCNPPFPSHFASASSFLPSSYTLPKRSLPQKFRSATECGNFARVHATLGDNTILICGTHCFSPLCR